MQKRKHKPSNRSTNQTQKQQTQTHILFLTSLSLFFTPSHSQLSLDYYKQKCPTFEQTIRDTITNKQITSPTTAAAMLRLFSHDCLTNGCDASILISSTPFQLRWVWCRYQPLSPWRCLRRDRTRQDCVGANLFEHRLLCWHLGCSHSWLKYL